MPVYTCKDHKATDVMIYLSQGERLWKCGTCGNNENLVELPVDMIMFECKKHSTQYMLSDSRKDDFSGWYCDECCRNENGRYGIINLIPFNAPITPEEEKRAANLPQAEDVAKYPHCFL